MLRVEAGSNTNKLSRVAASAADKTLMDGSKGILRHFKVDIYKQTGKEKDAVVCKW
jgi:hypothetical protein